jgi:hypothetical protein
MFLRLEDIPPRIGSQRVGGDGIVFSNVNPSIQGSDEAADLRQIAYDNLGRPRLDHELLCDRYRVECESLWGGRCNKTFPSSSLSMCDIRVVFKSPFDAQNYLKHGKPYMAEYEMSDLMLPRKVGKQKVGFKAIPHETVGDRSSLSHNADPALSMFGDMRNSCLLFTVGRIMVKIYLFTTGALSGEVHSIALGLGEKAVARCKEWLASAGETPNLPEGTRGAHAKSIQSALELSMALRKKLLLRTPRLEERLILAKYLAPFRCGNTGCKEYAGKQVCSRCSFAR